MYVRPVWLVLGGFYISMKLKNAIDQFIKWKGLEIKQNTVRGYYLDLLQFCLYMRNHDVEFIKEEHTTDYFNEMKMLGWKNNSLTHKSSALRKLFEYCRMKGMNTINYEMIQVVQRNYTPAKVAEDWEIEKLLELCPVNTSNLQQIRNRAIITLLRDTGARSGEICSFNVDDIKPCEMKTVIKTEKSRGLAPIREIFWEPETDQDIHRWLKARNELIEKLESNHKEIRNPEALFVGYSSWQAGKRITSHAVSIILRKLSRRAGLDTVNPHSFRHRRGHELSKSGANNSIISGILGHSSLSSSYIYTMMNSSELQEAYKKFRPAKSSKYRTVGY